MSKLKVEFNYSGEGRWRGVTKWSREEEERTDEHVKSHHPSRSWRVRGFHMLVCSLFLFPASFPYPLPPTFTWIVNFNFDTTEKDVNTWVFFLFVLVDTPKLEDINPTSIRSKKKSRWFTSILNNSYHSFIIWCSIYKSFVLYISNKILELKVNIVLLIVKFESAI